MALELTMDDLPDEVLEYVFSKLTLHELKTVRLVSKKWLKVGISYGITQNELVQIELKDLHRLQTRRDCLNIKIESRNSFSTDLNRQEEFWVVHGSSVRSLEVQFFSHHLQIVHSIINYCCNVKDLTLEFIRGSSDDVSDDADIVIVKGAQLKCLMSLTLKLIPSAFITGAAFLRLTENVPNLKRLVLSFYVHRGWLSVGPIKFLIVKQAFTLTELVLRNCDFATDSFLKDVFLQIGPQMTGLYLSGLKLKSIDCLSQHADKLPNLKKLELNELDWGGDGGNSLRKLVHFTKLEFISLSDTQFCDKDVIPLIGLEHLKALNIGGFFVENACGGILKCFGNKIFPNLVALQMQGLTCATDGVLAAISPNLPNVKFIDLSNCGDIFTSAGVSAIITNCKLLTHLALRGCSAVDSISHHVPNLKFLDLGGCNITSKGLQQVVTNCPQLTHLSILACVRIKNLEPACSLKNLLHLFMSHCTGLDPTKISKLRFDNLKTIVLAGISAPDGGFKKLFENCPRLQSAFLGLVTLVRGQYGVVEGLPTERLFPFHFTIFDF